MQPLSAKPVTGGITELAQSRAHRSHLLVYGGAVERARATWTDQRLDDMARRMDDGFNRVDADIRALRGEMNSLRGEMGVRFEASDARFDAFQRTMLQLGGGMMVTFVVGFASILIAQLA